MLCYDSNCSYQPEACDSYNYARTVHQEITIPQLGVKKAGSMCAVHVSIPLISLLRNYRIFYLFIYLFFHFLFFSWGTPLHSLRFNPSPAEPEVNRWQVSFLCFIGLYNILCLCIYLVYRPKDNSARVIFFPPWYSSLIQYHIVFLAPHLKSVLFSRLFKTI